MTRSEPWYWRDTAVVLAPFGTHPYSSGGMIADEEHLREFLGAAREGEAGVDRLSRPIRPRPGRPRGLPGGGRRPPADLAAGLS